MNEKDAELEDTTEGMQHGAVIFLDVLGWKGIWKRRKDSMVALDVILKVADLTK